MTFLLLFGIYTKEEEEKITPEENRREAEKQIGANLEKNMGNI